MRPIIGDEDGEHVGRSSPLPAYLGGVDSSCGRLLAGSARLGLSVALLSPWEECAPVVLCFMEGDAQYRPALPRNVEPGTARPLV